MRAFGVVAVALVACESPEQVDPGYFEVIASPGSDLLDRVDRLRVPGYSSTARYEAVRGAAGLDLTIELADLGDSGCSLPIPTFVEGFDANGVLIATGRLVFCRAARGRARGRVFLAPPNSLTPAPARLSSVRSEVVGHSIGTVLFAGGREASGAVSDALDAYDPCWHEVTTTTLPFPRAGVSLFSYNGGVYGFGGTGPDGAATASLFRFTPARDGSMGSFALLDAQPGFERTGQRAFVIAGNDVVITGDPPASLDTGNVTMRARPNTPPLSANAAVDDDASVVGVVNPGVVDLVGFVEFAPEQTALPPGRDRAGIVAHYGGAFTVIGGSETSALQIDAFGGGIYNVVENVLDQPRFDATVAASSNGTLVIGGVDANGTAIPTAEYVFGSGHIATIPVTPRRRRVVLPLPNGQFAITGGEDATDVIELFTPRNLSVDCLTP